MNLTESVYVGRFDCIFCMNVLIYFSESRRASLSSAFMTIWNRGVISFSAMPSRCRLQVRFKQSMEGGARLLQKPMNVPPLARTRRRDPMSGPGPEFVELFLQEAMRALQFLREYSGILLDPYPLHEDIERLYIAAHGVAGTAGTYGYKCFSTRSPANSRTSFSTP